jgi:putative addiction module component (TIGR02574 family)
MDAAILDEVKKLSPTERMELIDAIWDTLAHCP